MMRDLVQLEKSQSTPLGVEMVRVDEVWMPMVVHSGRVSLLKRDSVLAARSNKVKAKTLRILKECRAGSSLLQKSTTVFPVKIAHKDDFLAVVALFKAIYAVQLHEAEAHMSKWNAVFSEMRSVFSISRYNICMRRYLYIP